MTTVAIIDDAQLTRQQLKKFFEDTLGFEVVAQGADGQEAIDLYISYSPDLITIDLTVPEKSGVEAIKEIFAHDKNANILVISAVKDAALITEAIQLGAKGFVQKPIQLGNEDYIQNFKDEVEDSLA